jgi:cobaltochelatase CobT
MDSDAVNQERFKLAIASSLRALAGRDIEVIFTQHTARESGDKVYIPFSALPKNMDEAELVRGLADSLALRLRYHDASAHHRLRQRSGLSQHILNQLEQARLESLGAQQFKGVSHNLQHVISQRLNALRRHDAETSPEIGLPEVLGLMVREAATGQKPPADVQWVMDIWKPWIIARARLDIDGLAALVHDQHAFMAQAIQMLQQLQVDGKESPDAGLDGEQEDVTASSNDDTPSLLPTREGEEIQSDGDMEDTPDEGDNQLGEQQEIKAEPDPDPVLQALQSGGVGGERMVDVFDPWQNYAIYSRAYDVVAHAQELVTLDELTHLRAQLDEQLSHLKGIVTRLAHRLQRRLLALQQRRWDFDQEEGFLDAARLTRAVIDPLAPLAFKQERETSFRDTVVTILIDNSGSMRGRPISIAAITADILARTLEQCQVRVEILGFTTSAWKGGRVREQWQQDGKPAYPGRLNELRHIIYKPATQPWRRCKLNLGLMLKEGLLKENIDGEALLWAHQRLLGYPEARRILMVLSDGAPVDDATLSNNSTSYLENHLRRVIQYIEQRSPVELLAIGIGHDVTRYYQRAITIQDASQLGLAMVDKLSSLISFQPHA